MDVQVLFSFRCVSVSNVFVYFKLFQAMLWVQILFLLKLTIIYIVLFIPKTIFIVNYDSKPVLLVLCHLRNLLSIYQHTKKGLVKIFRVKCVCRALWRLKRLYHAQDTKLHASVSVSHTFLDLPSEIWKKVCLAIIPHAYHVLMKRPCF